MISINELIGSLERSIGKKATIEYHPQHPADMNTSQADVTKAKKILNWEPRVSLEEGIRGVVDWYMKERSWAQDILTD